MNHLLEYLLPVNLSTGNNIVNRNIRIVKVIPEDSRLAAWVGWGGITENATIGTNVRAFLVLPIGLIASAVVRVNRSRDSGRD